MVSSAQLPVLLLGVILVPGLVFMQTHAELCHCELGEGLWVMLCEE